jgi:Bacterial SH3 domain
VLRGKLISQKSSETRYKLASRSALGLFCLSLAGCNSLPKVPLPETGIQQVEQRLSEEHEAERGKWLAEKEAQQQEIERLQKLLAEKDSYIRHQARQQDQPKPVQETPPQAAPAQIKLQRLATRPAAASAIAEAEVFMESLKQSATNGEEALQSQAQRFLQAATASFAEDNYATAMDRAAQAREVVDMVRNNRTRKADQTVLLQTPLPLRATANSNLRQNPNLKSTVLGVLKKDSILTAGAYQGDWLKVQTAEGEAGWVLNTLVEAHIGKP